VIVHHDTSLSASAEVILRESRHWELLRKRWAKRTHHSVFRVDGCYEVKKYEMPLDARIYRRPWLVEDACLRRLDGNGAPRSFGWLEQIEENQRVVWLVKEYIAGESLCSFKEAAIPAVACLMARIHSLRIITGEPKPQNFIRSLDGRMLFPNFGRAKLYLYHNPFFFLCIGGELAKLRREEFQWDTDLWNAFRPLYFKALQISALCRALIWVSCGIAIGMRMARKRIQGQSPWS
jgi:hypothetical protein